MELTRKRSHGLALTVSLLYVFAIVPTSMHREALLMHAGWFLALALLWRGIPWPPRFTLAALLVGFSLVCAIVGGYYQINFHEKILRAEVQRLELELFGPGPFEDRQREYEQARAGDPDVREHLFERVRDRRPGWGQAAFVLHETLVPSHEASWRSTMYRGCGFGYSGPLGTWDEIGYLKDAYGLAVELRRQAELERDAVLSKWPFPPVSPER